MKGKLMIRLIHNTGFQISFDNGYTVDCRFGVGSCCSGGDLGHGNIGSPADQDIVESYNCELTIFNKDMKSVTYDILSGAGAKFDYGLEAAGYVSADNVGWVIGYVSSLTGNGVIPNVVSDAVKRIPIEELDISIRAYNCLKRANYNVLGDFIGVSFDDIICVRNLGRKCADEIRKLLKPYGIILL